MQLLLATKFSICRCLLFTPMELICCGMAEAEDIAQIGEEEVYHQNLVRSYYKQYFEINQLLILTFKGNK